jgi:replication-associated recombination protein RarA
MKRHTAEHNFIIDEVISALQKSIRRKEKEDAIYWALQLHNCGYGNAVFKRLTIILSNIINQSFY